MKRWLAFTPLALLLVLVIVAYERLTSEHPAPASFSSPVRPVPDMQLAQLDGGPSSLASMKGQVFLVNVWATWCAPCRAEHPILMKMHDQGVPIVGILYQDPKGPVREFLKTAGNPFSRVMLDPEGDAGLAVGISGVPETFLVDAKGMIVKTVRAPIADESLMKDMVDAWRAEAAKAGAAPATPAAS